MRTLDKQEIFTLFESQPRLRYKKKGMFLYRTATFAETVLTIVAGKLETYKTANVGDAILRNLEIGGSAETYIIDGKKFEGRYDCTQESHTIDGNSWKVCLAKGMIEAFEYGGGQGNRVEEIKFMAPWDAEMICHPGDFLAPPFPETLMTYTE